MENWPTCLPEVRAASGSCRTWRRPARSSFRWTDTARGSAITACSPTCSSWSCGIAEPGELPALHATAAGWYAGHGYPAEAVRHAQAAREWSLAARLLSDHWIDLDLGGQAATARELLTAFPAGFAALDAELTALMAAAELARGSLAGGRTAACPGHPAVLVGIPGSGAGAS